MSGKELEILAYDKKKSSKGIFSSFFNPPSFDEEIADLFNKAGNSYIVEKQIEDAVRCYMLAYEEYDKLKNHDYYSMKNLMLAITNAKETNIFSCEKLIELLTIVAKNNGKNGKLKEHNEKYLEISEIYEQNNNIQQAIDVLDNCIYINSIYYDDILKKKAELMIKQFKYIDAGNVYEKIVENIIARDKKSSYYSSRQYATLSVLCALASNDLVCANNRCTKYKNYDEMFDVDHDGKLACSVLISIENQNIRDFENSCDNYNRVLKLKSSYITLLTVAKKYIDQQEEDINTTNNQHENDYNEEDFC